MTNRERLTELRYQMEKNSFILSIIEARIAVILHAEEMGYPDTETGLITKTSPQYVAMVRSLKDKYSSKEAPNGMRASSIEELAQIIYDKVYVEDHKYAGQFSKFDTDLLDSWFELKQRQEALFNSIIDRQQAQAVFKDSYFQKFGKKLSIREIQEKSEQTQQETEPEEEIEIMPGETPEQAKARIDMGEAMRGWVADERREERLETLFELVQDGTLSAGNAFEYVPSDYGLDFDSFLRMQEAWEEEKQDDKQGN